MRNAVRFDHIETGWIEAMEATRIYGFSKYRGAREHSIKMIVSISLNQSLGSLVIQKSRSFGLPVRGPYCVGLTKSEANLFLANPKCNC